MQLARVDAVIVGAGGIGLAWTQYLIDKGWRVRVVSRRPSAALSLGAEYRATPLLQIAQLDYRDEAGLATLATWLVQCQPRLLCYCDGLLHEAISNDGAEHGSVDRSLLITPEKSISALSGPQLLTYMQINAIFPCVLLRELHRLGGQAWPLKLVFLSAKVGSISDNRLGGWYGYRASKAMLNQLLKTASIEFKRTHKNWQIIALHPGTVATRLSAPFRPVSHPDVRSAALAVQQLQSAVEQNSESGVFIDWRGHVIPW